MRSRRRPEAASEPEPRGSDEDDATQRRVKSEKTGKERWEVVGYYGGNPGAALRRASNILLEREPARAASIRDLVDRMDGHLVEVEGRVTRALARLQPTEG